MTIMFSKNMADECLVEFLHAELVKYVADSSEEKVDISTLEYLGYITGFRIIERLTKEWPPFKNELDTMKFLCTDFWSSVYKKQIDNLRTNHHGVYVLQDNAFRYLVRLSSQKQYLDVAPKFVAFTCGLVRGALANLGITCLVTAEVEHMPACKFHIQHLCISSMNKTSGTGKSALNYYQIIFPYYSFPQDVSKKRTEKFFVNTTISTIFLNAENISEPLTMPTSKDWAKRLGESRIRRRDLTAKRSFSVRKKSRGRS